VAQLPQPSAAGAILERTDFREDRLSKSIEKAEAKILNLARSIVPTARVSSVATREAYTCAVIVDTDAEKRIVNDHPSLLAEMKEVAGSILHRPIYMTAESQETVDRKWGGDWNYVFR
jgi:hypothetical protein